MEICNQCPRRCNIDRDKKVGFCGVPNNIKIAKTMLHFWEEPMISGTKGSGTIFFSGCNLKCNYCQNFKISHQLYGKYYTINQLAEIFKSLQEKGAHNINLVTPSHYVNQIIEALKIFRPNIPIVYNSSGYDSLEELEKLKDYIDIYLVDLKYYDKQLSASLSKAPDYFEVASKAILKMKEMQPKNIIKNGIMKKGVIIRHLVLPNHTDDSLKILDWIRANLPVDTLVSIMGQYTPYYKCSADINRPLKILEYKRVISYFNKIGLINGLQQDLSSSSTQYIPDFEQDKA